MRKQQAGFTLIELVIVTAVIGILAGIALMKFYNESTPAKQAVCDYNRNIGEKAYSAYLTMGGAYNPAGQTGAAFLVNAGLLASDLKGGTFTWVQDAGGSVRLNCVPNGGIVALTPLGSTFQAISSGMIQLLEDYYVENNRYARSWGTYVFTDIGLLPGDWQNPVNNMYYKPGGNRLSIRPAAGYQFLVSSAVTGNTMIMKDTYSWDLVYNVADKTWYYRSISSGNEIAITSLQVVKY